MTALSFSSYYIIFNYDLKQKHTFTIAMHEYIKNIRPVSPAPIYASTYSVAYIKKII